MGNSSLSPSIKVISASEFSDLLTKLKRDYQSQYYAMYSSLWNGIVTDPVLMLVPVDDHMVHRGDGVFEAFKCVNGNLYNVHRHLKRLEYSASQV
ncbi:MAG: aminodeoxychorismate lyase, partial [Deltaproteobacteria bacterium]